MQFVIEDDLTFEQIRENSPQWIVYACAQWQHPIARVTERIIASPTYVLTLLDPNEAESDDKAELKLDSEDAVTEAIMNYVNTIMNYVNRLAEE